MKYLSIIIAVLLTSVVGTSQDIEIYVSDAGNFNKPPWQILKFDGDGSKPEVFISDSLNWPQDILFLESTNTVLISNLGTNKITRHDATSGEYLNDFARGISGPTRIKIGPEGLLYVLQWSGDGLVKRYDLDGTWVDDFTSVGVSQSIGMDWDGMGNLYVSSYGDSLVRKFDESGEDLGVFISSGLSGPTNIWFDDTGDLLVSDYRASSIKRFTSDGEPKGDFITGLSNSEGVDFLPNGDILIGNGATHSVKQFNGQGDFIGDIIPDGAGGLITPNAVVLREVVTSSIQEGERSGVPIITPTIGSEFNLDESILKDIAFIDILDSTGASMKRMESVTDGRLAMAGLSQGLYTIHIRLVDGRAYVRSVILRR